MLKWAGKNRMVGMKVNNAAPVSFKGVYRIRGAEDVLDEVCWYLRRKAKNFDNHFSFMDIRLVNAKPAGLDGFLRTQPRKDVDMEEVTEFVTDSLLDMISARINKTTKIPKFPVKDMHIDLFATNKDKIAIETRLAGILDECHQYPGKIPVVEKLSRIMRMVNQARGQIDIGKPITTIRPTALASQADLDVSKVPLFHGEMVLNAFKKDGFDIIEGGFKG